MLGGPGAGKTVQSAHAAEAMNLFHVSAGGLLRAFVNEKSANTKNSDEDHCDMYTSPGDNNNNYNGSGDKVDTLQWNRWRDECRELLAKGNVVPSHITVRLLERAARAMRASSSSSSLSDAYSGMIVDGFPRNESNRAAFVSHVCRLFIVCLNHYIRRY